MRARYMARVHALTTWRRIVAVLCFAGLRSRKTAGVDTTRLLRRDYIVIVMLNEGRVVAEVCRDNGERDRDECQLTRFFCGILLKNRFFRLCPTQPTNALEC